MRQGKTSPASREWMLDQKAQSWEEVLGDICNLIVQGSAAAFWELPLHSQAPTAGQHGRKTSTVLRHLGAGPTSAMPAGSEGLYLPKGFFLCSCKSWQVLLCYQDNENNANVSSLDCELFYPYNQNPHLFARSPPSHKTRLPSSGQATKHLGLAGNALWSGRTGWAFLVVTQASKQVEIKFCCWMWSSSITEELSFQAVQNSSLLIRKDLQEFCLSSSYLQISWEFQLVQV